MECSETDQENFRKMKLLVTALSLMFAACLASMAQPKPSPTPSKAEFESKAKEVAEMEKQ